MLCNDDDDGDCDVDFLMALPILSPRENLGDQQGARGIEKHTPQQRTPAPCVEIIKRRLHSTTRRNPEAPTLADKNKGEHGKGEAHHVATPCGLFSLNGLFKVKTGLGPNNHYGIHSWKLSHTGCKMSRPSVGTQLPIRPST